MFCSFVDIDGHRSLSAPTTLVLLLSDFLSLVGYRHPLVWQTVLAILGSLLLVEDHHHHFMD
jgi:hypothetical protein